MSIEENKEVIIEHGKIVETWADMDFVGVLQQVGLIPAQN